MIERVPLPPRGRKPVYPFDSLAVGESFFTPGATTARLCAAARRVTLADTKADREARKFTVRAARESGVDGARCWRTA